jgi:hypothetical protein
MFQHQGMHPAEQGCAFLGATVPVRLKRLVSGVDGTPGFLGAGIRNRAYDLAASGVRDLKLSPVVGVAPL